MMTEYTSVLRDDAMSTAEAVRRGEADAVVKFAKRLVLQKQIPRDCVVCGHPVPTWPTLTHLSTDRNPKMTTFALAALVLAPFYPVATMLFRVFPIVAMTT